MLGVGAKTITMSMSTSIQAFIPDTDEAYNKHKKVLLACLEADVELPKKTAEYFGSEYAEEYLLEEKLEIDLEEGKHYNEFSKDSSEGFEIELKNIPEGVTKIRFSNSY